MGRMMKKAIRKTYHWMQEHYATFRFLVFMKEHGITRRINSILRRANDRKERVVPTEEMKESLAFFTENRDRAARAMKLLADEKSREVWGGGNAISYA